MYEIRPESIKTFIEDKSIKLPRFQRKQTWNDKKNFELCISIFKGFPIGVIVINKESSREGRNKWLLDGRQRRNAFINMMNDPEIIYDWSKRFLKLSNTDQPHDIKIKFYNKIEDYLGKDKTELDDEDNNENSDEEDESNKDTTDLLQISSSVNNAENKDLEILLKIILMCHQKNDRDSGFTRPFDFTKYIDNLEYSEFIDGNIHLSSKKLRSWMRTFISYCSDNDLECSPIKKEVFYKYIISRYKLSDDEKNLEKQIEKWWNDILEKFEIVELIDSILQETKIGFIELSNVDANSAQSIFEIINNKGTPLTAVEVLSAKPSWNIEIKNPSDKLKYKVKDLYNEMEMQPQNIVKWDVPATLMDRLENVGFIFKELKYKQKKQFEKKITLGFKIMSAVYEKGITKNHIAALGENDQINWQVDPESLITDLNLMGKILCNDNFYKYLNSWKTNLMELTSESVAISFLVITYMDWKRKGKPSNNSNKTKTFIKNSIISIDTLLYEYLNKQWRSSSDSKIADNINKLSTTDDMFNCIKQDKWINLIEEIIDNNRINASDLKTDKIDDYVKTILYYYYILSKKSGPDDIDVKIEVDHIIPKAIWTSSAINNKDKMVNNLFNLALLPKKQNITKKDKKLIEILNDTWLTEQVEKYTNISKKDFQKYSNMNNINELKELRKASFISTFKHTRNELLNN